MAKEKKKRGCFGCLSWIFIIIVGLLALSIFLSTGDDDDETDEVIEDEQEVEEEVIQDEPEEVVEETEVTEEDEENIEGLEEEFIEEIEGGQEDEIVTNEFTHEVIEGYDFYTIVITMSWTEESLLRNFSMFGADLLKDIHDDLDNGVILRLVAPMRDENGNETLTVVSHVWYRQDTIERIDFDNWPQIDKSGLYDTADGVTIHNFITRETTQGQKIPDGEVPDVYRFGIGEEYEPE